MTEKEAIKILRNIQNAKKVEYEDASAAAPLFQRAGRFAGNVRWMLWERLEICQ